jgi:hypothetical protein
MAEPTAPPAAKAGTDEAFISTIVGKRIEPSAANSPAAESARPRRRPPTETPGPAPPEKDGSSSNIYVFLGFAAVVLLGLLLLYLLSTIFLG